MLAIVLAAAPARAAEERPPLRVVSFNLLHGGPRSGLFGDGGALEERLELVTAELRALRPDIVGLQEASAGWGRGNVAARLAESLGMSHVYASATTRVFPVRLLGHVIVRAINFDEGPAVLSRFPIVGSEVFDLPRCVKRLDPRVLLRADVRTPLGDVAVFSTHISRDDCQLARVAEIVRAHARTGPALLMGDLNAGERLAGIGGLSGDGGFVDAFRAANPTDPGLTVWQRPGASEPTVHRRVDYIFVAGARPDAVCASRVVLDRPRRYADGRTLWPSDHYGVLAELRLFGIKCAP
jgi:endonuclease/exonuclease/phosphatase family metal-dependent hydrolase